MSLFVTEDDEYQDKTSVSPPAELPPAEISVERTQALYAQNNVPDPNLIPVIRSNEPSTIPVYESNDICCTLPLRFYQEITETMLSHDGLLILGRGLGCDLVTVNLLYALSSPAVSLQHGNVVQKKRSLVILLNARDDEIVKMKEALLELQWMNSSYFSEPEESLEDDWESPLRVVTGTDLNNTSKRRLAYEKGGALSISSRILVVDLLTGIVNPQDITGIIITHSERVKETSNESFIVNLYKDGNDWGFVKAISDEPESFTGFTPLATKLKILRLLNVFLWPRFHVEVSQLLLKGSGKQTNMVTEIAVRLSAKMNKIQAAVLSCLQACLLELRRHNPSLETEYWDMENIHDKDFVARVRLSLESQWHRISWTSKQLVYDLTTLKDLLSALLAEDSLLFYQRVQGIVDASIRSSPSGMASNTTSPWLMMDEATTIIAFAKERALGKVSVNRGSVQLNGEEVQEKGEPHIEQEIVYNLEELPKWEQLSMVIGDIMHERSIEAKKSEGPILIMCALEKTAKQLSHVLAMARKKEYTPTGKRSFSSRRFMVRQLRKYLEWKSITMLTRKLTSEFAAEESKQEGVDTPSEEKLNTSKTFTRGKDGPQSKRRRNRGAAAIASVNRLYAGSSYEKNATAQELEDDIIQSVENRLKEDSDEELVDKTDEGSSKEDDVVICDVVNTEIQRYNRIQHIDKFNQIVIETYDDHTNEFLLQEISPSYIIMYEPDLSFIRRVEIFQALNPSSPAKAFFMYYGTSVEEQSHLLRIKNEKQAFTRLIKEKARLGKTFSGDNDNWKFHLKKQHVVNTRIAGGANFRTEADEMRVVVDSREFNSPLPKLLYRVGIKVVPCMLTVGDYILSPKICVERKAIPDLISSFKSGRLYQQCEHMFRHYELPTLLIEFDESKSFSFEPFAELRPPGQKATTSAIGVKLSKQEIQLKITELLVSFPKLKVIWSYSPYETAQIFLELKANQKEPDVEEALAKGVNPTIATKDGPPMFNDDAIDVLHTIPGVNNLNYINIIKNVLSLSEFVQLSLEEIQNLIGEENGSRAHHFVNHRVH